MVQLLLSAGASNRTARRHDGSTPLHAAAFGGHTDVLHMLLQAGADMDVEQLDGSTPLLLAAFAGKDIAVSALLSARAGHSIADRRGWTPLHGACQAPEHSLK